MIRDVPNPDILSTICRTDYREGRYWGVGDKLGATIAI